MPDRRRTKAEERSYAALIGELHELEYWRNNDLLKRRAIPSEWYGLARSVPTRPRKVRVTAAFDAEVVRWFRSMGHGYQARMNAVLRAYMLAVLSKEIETEGDRDWKGDPI